MIRRNMGGFGVGRFYFWIWVLVLRVRLVCENVLSCMFRNMCILLYSCFILM